MIPKTENHYLLLW